MISRIGRFATREAGSATVEFVIIVPVFMMLMATAIESGILTSREAMLQRGLEMSVRELRIGTGRNLEVEQLKKSICRQAAILPDCTRNIRLELAPLDRATWAPNPPMKNDCVDRTKEEIRPAMNYTRGKENELMLIRVCVVFDPLFPHYGVGQKLAKDASGAYALTALSAFVNEPL